MASYETSLKKKIKAVCLKYSNKSTDNYTLRLIFWKPILVLHNLKFTNIQVNNKSSKIPKFQSFIHTRKHALSLKKAF